MNHSFATGVCVGEVTRTRMPRAEPSRPTAGAPRTSLADFRRPYDSTPKKVDVLISFKCMLLIASSGNSAVLRPLGVG